MFPHTRYIENIDQFCDRWCAKCPMTARCEAFARTRRDTLPGAPDPVDDLQALKNLRAFVVLAAQALHNPPAAEEPSAAPSARQAPSPAPAPAGVASVTAPPPATHPAILGVLGYLHSVRGWFAEEQSWLREKRRSLRVLAAVSAEPASVLAEAEVLVDALETIGWDVSVISDRVERAFDAVPTDRRAANGHAKVALLSIDRSVEAWLAIRRRRRACPETVIPIVQLLAQLRAHLEGAFPDARRFARPGFDGNGPELWAGELTGVVAGPRP